MRTPNWSKQFLGVDLDSKLIIERDQFLVPNVCCKVLIALDSGQENLDLSIITAQIVRFLQKIANWTADLVMLVKELDKTNYRKAFGELEALVANNTFQITYFKKSKP